MKVQIVHASSLGSTADIAAAIGLAIERRGHRVVVEPADTASDPRGFDASVIGSAVHGGSWLAPASDFVRAHTSALAERPVWLFSVGPVGSTGPTTVDDPEEVYEFRRSVGPRGHRQFSGAHDRSNPAIERLPRLERFIARRFIPAGDFRDWPAIETWAGEIADAIGAVHEAVR